MEKKVKAKKLNFNIMPHSMEAEQSVLGAMLINDEVTMDILSSLKEEDFYAPAHKKIFNAAYELYKQNKPIDFVTVTDALEKSNCLVEVGGIDYITHLTNVLPAAANYKNYVEMVKRDSLLRKLIECGRDISEKAYEATDREEMLQYAEKQIFDISEKEETSSLELIDGAVKEVIDKFDKIGKNPNILRGLTTGYTELDRMTKGLQNSDLILIGGRPGSGKTSFAMNLAVNVALSGKNVAIFSLEMPKSQIAQRALCSIAGVSMEKALKGELSVEEWKAIVLAGEKLGEANMFIDDSGYTKPIDILSKCRRLKREKGLDLVMIDYLQLMSTGKNKVESRQLEIGEMTRNLKIAARELNVPIILLSQLSREVEKSTRKDHRPVISDLRESGSIEQDADIVLFIYRPDMYNDVATEDEPGVAEVIVAKHRNGPIGTIKLRWIGETTTFVNLDYKPKKNYNRDPATVIHETFNEPPMEDVPPPEDDEVPPIDFDEYNGEE